MNDRLTIAAAWLDFVPPEPHYYLQAFTRCYQRGARSVCIEPFNQQSVFVAHQIASKYGATVRINDATAPLDCLILLDTDVATLSERLQSLIDVPCRVIAPITDRYYRHQSYFLLTLPKAGTHLLYELMRTFHIGSGGPAPPVRAGHWHSLIHEHTHTAAATFFQELSNFPRGGADHPFFAHPALFIYRNPMDVVVSETFYLIKKDKTPLAHYYTTLSDQERCLSLIVDDPLLWGIRDRVRGYTAWSRLPNVISVSFEELIGAAGGGCDEAQHRTIWSLQLKLHVPGSPQEHGKSIFNTDSPTFRRGAINSHRAFFQDEHYEAFRRLNQDFMHELGYDINDAFAPGYVPRFVETFRRRPLQLQAAADAAEEPSRRRAAA
jgi:hypothetical protein